LGLFGLAIVRRADELDVEKQTTDEEALQLRAIFEHRMPRYNGDPEKARYSTASRAVLFEHGAKTPCTASTAVLYVRVK
jgi:hypothetical protein